MEHKKLWIRWRRISDLVDEYMHMIESANLWRNVQICKAVVQVFNREYF
jgi:hypothetical protein